MDLHLILLCLCIFAIAFLYSSVGHAGASGYIATMTLFGLAPAVIKPTALTLNILVATIGTFQFWKAGHFSWRLFWPFAVLAIPMAYLGGYLNLPAHAFKIVIGVVLLCSALFFMFRLTNDEVRHRPGYLICLLTGGGLGLVAGLTGTGREFPDATPAHLAMGAHERDGRGVGPLHPSEFDRGLVRQFQRHTPFPGSRFDSGRGGAWWRNPWLLPGKQPI